MASLQRKEGCNMFGAFHPSFPQNVHVDWIFGNHVALLWKYFEGNTKYKTSIYSTFSGIEEVEYRHDAPLKSVLFSFSNYVPEPVWGIDDHLLPKSLKWTSKARREAKAASNQDIKAYEGAILKVLLETRIHILIELLRLQAHHQT